jgi:hypothetical protein
MRSTPSSLEICNWLLIGPSRIEQLTQTMVEREPSRERMLHLQEECVDNFHSLSRSSMTLLHRNSSLKSRLDERVSLIANLESAYKEYECPVYWTRSKLNLERRICAKQERTMEWVREQERSIGVLDGKDKSQEQLMLNLKQSYIAPILMVLCGTDLMLIDCKPQRSKANRIAPRSRTCETT